MMASQSTAPDNVQADVLVDHEQRIGNSTFSVAWVLNSLKTNDQTFIQRHGTRIVKDVTAVDISGGKGFMSAVYRCTIRFSDSASDNDVYTSILKVPGLESFDKVADTFDDMDDSKLQLSKFMGMHSLEVEFYTHFAPRLEIPVPKVFGSRLWTGKQQGCLHMEDLTCRSDHLTFFDSMNERQLRDVTRHLVHMHKQVLLMDPQEWRGKYLEHQKAFLGYSDFMGMCFRNFIKQVRNPEPFQEYWEKYGKLFSNPDFFNWVVLESHKEVGVPPVLVHGDLWSGNILFETDADGFVTDRVAAFVDWQVMHEGNPMMDFARCLANCTDGDTRRCVERRLFHDYHQQLSRELQNEGRSVPFSVEQLQRAYAFCFLVQGFFPVVMVSFNEPNLSRAPHDAALNRARLDKTVLRALHALEDMDRLLQGEYRHLLQQFGQ